MLRPWQGVICAESAHLNVDEGGAPERMGGIKLLTVPTPDGKLTPELVDRRIVRIGDEHVVQPGRGLGHAVDRARDAVLARGAARAAEHAHAHGMLFHIDGSRLANAAAALDVGLGDVARGADVVSLGGTKVGLLAAEAVVVLQPGARAVAAVPAQAVDAAGVEDALRVSAQLLALLEGDLWRRAAGHANAMARAAGGRRARRADAHAGGRARTRVFAILPPGAAEQLQQDFKFYVWDEHTGEVRWMCSWDTTEEDVDAFVAAILGVVRASPYRCGPRTPRDMTRRSA